MRVTPTMQQFLDGLVDDLVEWRDAVLVKRRKCKCDCCGSETALWEGASSEGKGDHYADWVQEIINTAMAVSSGLDSDSPDTNLHETNCANEIIAKRLAALQEGGSDE